MADVAVVGIGAVFPGAGDAPTFWDNIRSGVDAITEVPKDRWDTEVYYRPGEDGADRFYCRRGGFVDDLADFDPAQFGIMPSAVDGTEPDQLLMLRTAAEAIADSGALPPRERVGVIIGRGGYLTPGLARLDQRVHTTHQLTAVLEDLVPELSQGRLDAVRTAFAERLGPNRADPSIGLVPNFAASRLANRFDLRGPAYTVDAACASSLLAVDHAVRELTSGRCDAVLAGGVHTCHHPTLWSVFTQLRALSAAGLIRPFDRYADGTLLSEGAGVMLLKRLADAVAAGDQVYAVIRGVGVASDGRATSMMNPLADGQELAIRRAWEAAGLDPAAPGALGLLEAHGTATQVGDEVELATLERVFGPPASGTARSPSGGDAIGLGTVKSMIGHAMPAAGIAGLIKAAFAVHHGVLPPTLNISEPHPALARTRFELVTQARPWPEAAVRRAAVSAFGFGGINAHVILEAPPAARAPRRQAQAPARAGDMATEATARALGPAWPAPRQAQSADSVHQETILRLTSGSPAEMAESLNASDAVLLGRAGQEPGPGRCQLAIVAPDKRKLALARKIAARGTPWRGRSDIWFVPHPLLTSPQQVAFLFPGFEPEFAPRIEAVADRFGLPRPKLHNEGSGGGIVELALDVVAVGRLFAGALAELGITPGALAGHSLGEWTAMVVAGIYPQIDAFIASVRPGLAQVPDLVYAALGSSAERAAGLLPSGEVVVTHDNCPHQSVVCGPAPLVAAVVERARAAGILAQTLPFRTGFHSPMYAPYVAAARETLQHLDVGPASVPVWSATSLAPYPSQPEAVRDLVLRHLVEPVRFSQLIKVLHESGVRAFVQVGPGSLTGFIDDTLAGRDHLTVATAVPRRGGLAQLRRAAAGLWAEGLSPRFERLATPRRTAVRLRLGTPLVRLAGLPLTDVAGPLAAAGVIPPGGATPGAALPAVTVPAAIRPAATPALAEFGELMAETAAAAGAVAQALSRQPGTGDSGRAQADDVTMTREFSLGTMPDLADHCIIPQAEGWPDDSDRFPVVPMTTLLEVLADAASELAPDRVVVGFEQVTAARWLTVAPATTAQVRASREGPDRVKVRIEGYASGTVVMAGAYSPAPPRSPAGLRGERPAPVTARELYSGGWMFHGPRFAGVEDIVSVADGGVTGTLLSLPARGALLDSAGQLIGHWMQVSTSADQNVLPTGIRAVRLYGPQPPAGERLGTVVWIREVTATAMRADAELTTSDGRVWCRIEGWTTRRFATDEAIWKVKLQPGRNALSRLYPGGWNAVWERWPDSASRELIMRRYLNASERVRYEQLNPRQQRQWLLRVIVAKDAVRHWLWEHGAGPVYPAEVTVADSGTGVLVRGPFRAPQVSVACIAPERSRPGCAVAIADGEPADFSIDLADDGSLLVAQAGRPPRPIDAATRVVAV